MLCFTCLSTKREHIITEKRLKKYLIDLFSTTSEKLPYLKEIDYVLSVPNQKSHGDYAINAAMILSKKLKRNPREIATEIIENLEYDKSVIEKVEIAGPGFINFYFTSSYIPSIIKEIFEKKENFGRSEKYAGKKAMVEFISANPTGPLTVGHGRNAVIGDTVANLLEWIGYDVDREYYFNNAGRQMRVLGDSVRLRYLELLGNEITFPEDYYQGEYIKEIAAKLISEHGDKLTSEDAIWLKLTELGNEQDKVIVKSTGEPTYRLPDIAYHITKFERGYDLMIDLFGSDHNATYPDVLAGLRALGYDYEKVKVLIHQFVTIMQKGEVVKMSTRKANYITLDELVDEVGADVVRYFFNMRSITSHLNFDLELAKKQSDENPVFYLQYAHARIASILRMVKEQGLDSSLEHLDLLTQPVEQDLLKKFFEFPNEVLLSAENYEVHRIAIYLEELAALFHRFYTECRIIGSEKNLAEARISLSIATQTILRNGLSILGVTAPERM